jgi:hypothetical protein
MFETTLQMMKHQASKVKAQMKAFVAGEAGIMDAVDIIKGLVMIVVIGAIGVFVADRTLTATGTPANQKLLNFSNNTLAAGDTGSSFIVILVIAFIGGIAISYLAFFGGNRTK